MKYVPFSKWSSEELLKVLVHWSRESYMLLSKESLLKDDDVTILSLRWGVSLCCSLICSFKPLSFPLNFFYSLVLCTAMVCTNRMLGKLRPKISLNTLHLDPFSSKLLFLWIYSILWDNLVCSWANCSIWTLYESLTLLTCSIDLMICPSINSSYFYPIMRKDVSILPIILSNLPFICVIYWLTFSLSLVSSLHR